MTKDTTRTGSRLTQTTTGTRNPLPDRCEAPGCDARPHSRYKGGYAMCQKHWHRWAKYQSFDLPDRQAKPWSTCTVDGCDRRSRTRGGALCEVHYYRRYRTGSFDGPNYKRRHKVKAGYIRLTGVTSPIANKDGVVMEHRQVLFDSLGDGEHACHWCGKSVRWIRNGKCSRNLVVDHLNDKKDDNRVENLVPSCHPCNAARGMFMAWVRSHRCDPLIKQLLSEA